MHLPYALVRRLHELDQYLLFGEAESQQGVECETGISDPGESVIPTRQPAISQILCDVPISPTSHMFR
jgi:hypothetical protein